jgi:ribosomal 30S subunit maturation factor RimM
LGQLHEIIAGVAHDHYLIREVDPDNREFLLPAVKEFVLEIDLAGGKIIAEPPPGLPEL